MPESVIKKVEKLAERDKAKPGIYLKNRNREIYGWENEEYTIEEETTVQKVAPFTEIAAEFPGIEVERERPTPALDTNIETDESEEAANSERNCNLGELPRQNHNVMRENDVLMEGNPDKPNRVEVLEKPLSQGNQEK